MPPAKVTSGSTKPGRRRVEAAPIRKVGTRARPTTPTVTQLSKSRVQQIDAFWMQMHNLQVQRSSLHEKQEKCKAHLLQQLKDIRLEHERVQKTKAAMLQRRSIVQDSLAVFPDIKTEDVDCLRVALSRIDKLTSSMQQKEQEEKLVTRMKVVLEKPAAQETMRVCSQMWEDCQQQEEDFHAALERWINGQQPEAPTSETDSCPVCMDQIMLTACTVVLPCRHKLCLSCCLRLLDDRSLRCPLCRNMVHLLAVEEPAPQPDTRSQPPPPAAEEQDGMPFALSNSADQFETYHERVVRADRRISSVPLRSEQRLDSEEEDDEIPEGW